MKLFEFMQGTWRGIEVAIKKVPLTFIMNTLGGGGSDGKGGWGDEATGAAQRYERRLKMALREASMTSR